MFDFLQKPPEFLTYDQLSYMTAFKIWSKYSETFIAGVPNFDIFGLTGTELKHWCILGKHLSSFPKIILRLQKNILQEYFR